MTTGALDPALVAAVTAWIAEDPDETTREELAALLEAGDATTLHERFDHPLRFGTAGLRGVVGGGPGAMNRLVVRRTAAGVADWVRHKGAGAPAAGVVVGRDARHGSAAFAGDTVEVLAAAGVAVHVLDEPLPTPLTAFAVRHLAAAAGVVVTASHNPARDNGYKVYDADGSQVVPPADSEIEAASARLALAPAPPAEVAGRVVPVRHDEAASRTTPPPSATHRSGVAPARPARRLHAAARSRRGGRAPAPPARWVRRRRRRSPGRPRPGFPTVAFPNPEEPGAMDLVLALADTHVGGPRRSRMTPMRIAAASRSPSTGAGARSSGDELGALLGEDRCASTQGGDRLCATSIVSSSLLSKIAAAHDVAFAETLTGFKWLGRIGTELGKRLVFAYEEALGYAVSEAVADKDGMSAALLVCDLAARCKDASTSLPAQLDALYARHGVHLTRQLSFRREGADGMAAIQSAVADLLADPPTTFGGQAVLVVEDLSRGAGGLPPTEGVRLVAGTATRLIVRPSGTEPKLKAYVEVVGEPVGIGEVPASRAALRELLERCARDVAARLDA